MGPGSDSSISRLIIGGGLWLGCLFGLIYIFGEIFIYFIVYKIMFFLPIGVLWLACERWDRTVCYKFFWAGNLIYSVTIAWIIPYLYGYAVLDIFNFFG